MARGAFQVDMDWKDGKLVKAEILARNGGQLNIRHGRKTQTHNTKPGEQVTCHLPKTISQLLFLCRRLWGLAAQSFCRS